MTPREQYQKGYSPNKMDNMDNQSRMTQQQEYQRRTTSNQENIQRRTPSNQEDIRRMTPRDQYNNNQRMN